MNAFNRLVMLIIALLVLVVPVLLLLVAFGVLTGQQSGFGAITGALQSVPGVNLTSQTARWIFGIVSGLVCLISLLLIFRELTFGRPVARKVLVQDEPGKETTLTATAVKHLAEAAAREAGVVSPTARLASERDRRYDVLCDAQVPEGANVAELAARARENIARVLGEQRVPNNDVEVTIRGVAESNGNEAGEAGTRSNALATRQGAAVR
jgi:hypothetical protein